MKHRWGVYTYAGRDGKITSSSELKPVRIADIKLFVTINGLIGDVSVTLRFSNNFVSSGPAVFLFPLTHNASVKQCQAVVNSATGRRRKVDLECHPCDELEKPKKGYIIEQTASEMVELQLGVISPADDIEITLQYAILLGIDETGGVRFVFPTFLPRKLQTNYTELCDPEMLNALQFQCRAVVSGRYRIHKVLSDQRLTVQYKDEQRKYLQLDTQGGYSPVKDFSFSIIYVSIDKPTIHLHSPVQDSESTHWLLSSYCAHLTMHHNTRKPTTVNKRNEYILCIDRSGSMYGNKIEYTKEAISYFVRFLQPGSYFNIISYGSTVQPLFRTSQKLTAYTSMKAMKLRKSIKADMFATNIYGLLRFIYSQPNRTQNAKQVYLITDGAVENPDECIDLVTKNSDYTRVFTFGLDRTASRHLVSNLARAGNGKAFHLRNCNSLCHKVVDAMRLSAQSSLTDLRVSVQLPEGLVFTTQPDVLPSVLFAEETLSTCIIISGQVEDPKQTRCRVILSGRQGRDKFCHLRDFDLRDAVVTHGSPLHQLAAKTHLANLQKDVLKCRNADDILDIHEEMISLSQRTKTPCSQTRNISVELHGRYAVNSLPITLCRPEENMSPNSTTGIDIFQSSQLMMKSLMSLYSNHSRKHKREESQSRNSSMLKLITTPKTERKPQTSKPKPSDKRSSAKADSKRSPTNRMLEELGGEMMTSQMMGGVKLAEGESSDSLRSSLINTEMDDMSVSKYEDESPPLEMFNIIEEYPDKGRGSFGEMSGGSSGARSPARPTDSQAASDNTYENISAVNKLLQLLQRRERAGKPSIDSASPDKFTSTSDYYSLEVSPVSDISANTAARHRHAGNREQSKGHLVSEYSSSGGYSASTVLNRDTEYPSASSLRHLSIATPDIDPQPQYTSLWQQFRFQVTEHPGAARNIARQVSRYDPGREGRLALYDAEAIDVLAPEPDFSPRSLQAVYDNMHSPREDNLPQLGAGHSYHEDTREDSMPHFKAGQTNDPYQEDTIDYVNVQPKPFFVNHSSRQQNTEPQSSPQDGFAYSRNLLTIDTSMPSPKLAGGRVFSQSSHSPDARNNNNFHFAHGPKSNCQVGNSPVYDLKQPNPAGSRNQRQNHHEPEMDRATSIKPDTSDHIERVSLSHIELIKNFPMMDENVEPQQEALLSKPAKENDSGRHRLRRFINRIKRGFRRK